MNFIATSIQKFKSAFNKHSKTSTQKAKTNMSSTVTPPAIQTPPSVSPTPASGNKQLTADQSNFVVSAEQAIKRGWNAIAAEAEFVPTVDSVVSNVKNQVGVLNDIVASHTKKKTANSESINKLNVAHLAKIAAIEAENKEHDAQITAAQALVAKLNPVVATPTVTVVATTSAPTV